MKSPLSPVIQRVKLLPTKWLRATKAVLITGLTRPLTIKWVEFVVSVLLLVLSLPIILYYNLRKTYVLVAAKQKYGKNATLVSGMDYLFCLKRFSQDPSAALTTVLKVDGEIGLEALRHRVKANLTHNERWDGSWTHEKLRTVFEPFMGYCVARREEPFNINRHVNHIWDESTGMRIYCRTDQEVADLIDSISSKPFPTSDPAMSPWGIYLLHFKSAITRAEVKSGMLTSAVKSYIIIRSDHALFDGVSLVAILLNGLVDKEWGSEAKLCLNAFKEKSFLKRWWCEFCGLLQACGNMLRHSLLDKPDVNPFVQQRLKSPVAEEAMDGGVLKRPGKFAGFPTMIPLAVLEEIRSMTKVKINTIAIWAYLRALLQYSDKQALLTPSPSIAPVRHLSTSLSSACLKTLPSAPSSANLRTRRVSVNLDRDRRHWTFSLGQPVCMWTHGSSMVLENRLAVVRRTFNGHDLAGEGWDTLRKVQRNLEHPDIDEDVWAFHCGVKYLLGCLPLDALEGAYRFLGPKISVVSTNIRGSRIEQSILRKRMDWASIIVPIFEGVDVGLAAGSYNGNMTLVVAARKGAVSSRDDVQELQDLMEDEILTLHHSLTSTSIAKDDIQQFFAFPSGKI